MQLPFIYFKTLVFKFSKMNSAQLAAQSDFLDFAGNMLERHDSKDVSAPGLLEVK